MSMINEWGFEAGSDLEVAWLSYSEGSSIRANGKAAEHFMSRWARRDALRITSRYEAAPMVGIEHAPDAAKAWMVRTILTDEEKRIDASPEIVCWTFQGRPEANEANARRMATALNEFFEATS